VVSAADLPASSEELQVPAALRPTVTAIIAATDAVCERHLDGEYGVLCRRLVSWLASERPSPLVRGESGIWAAGVIYTVGSLNFLFDPAQVPHMRADELAAALGVVKSTMANKAARIRTILDLSWFEPELMRRSLLEQHPLTWLIEVNGIPVDARWLPHELQDEARRLGLIPDLDDLCAA
jgi:Domain of unknown function (DUF6398)